MASKQERIWTKARDNVQSAKRAAYDVFHCAANVEDWETSRFRRLIRRELAKLDAQYSDVIIPV